MDTENSMVITRGNKVWGQVEKGQGGISGAPEIYYSCINYCNPFKFNKIRIKSINEKRHLV